MRKARFTEHQIIAVLKSVEAGRTVKEICREAGISEASYYNWKAKYGGMEASDIKKMKDLDLDSDNLAKSFSGLDPLMENLGQSAGELSRVFMEFANKIGLNVGKGQTLPDAVYNTVVDGSANNAAEWIQSMTGFDLRSVGRFLGSESSVASQVLSGGWYSQMLPSTPAMQYQPSLPDIKATVDTQVEPYSQFGNLIDARADRRIEWSFDDHNFQINQSILGV